MSSSLGDFVNQVEYRWKEVDLLVQGAESFESDDPEMHNVMCRAATVLIVAHLEGFTKDLVKNIIRDLNNDSTFKNLPVAIKHTYASPFIKNKDGYVWPEKLMDLVKKFEALNCDISHECFLQVDETNKNGNPGIGRLTRIFTSFGVKNVFHHLKGSQLDDAFSGTYSEVTQLTDLLKQDVTLGSQNFPYQFDLNKFMLEKKELEKGATMWETFINDINKKRNDIAHGNQLDNVDGAQILRGQKSKVLLLQYGLIGILMNHFSNITCTTN